MVWFRFCFCLLVSSILPAQAPFGTVTGLVLDPSGAAVPGASVQLKNLETNIEAATPSNSSGQYVFPNVLPGSYRLQVAAKGFKPLTTRDFPVAAYRTIRSDLNIVVGETTDTVEVRDQVNTLLQVESPAIGASLSTTAVPDLPSTLRT